MEKSTGKKELWSREIDGIRRAMESRKPYRIANRISDMYLDLWDVATFPRVPIEHDPEQLAERTRRERIINRLAFLAGYHDDIMLILDLDDRYSAPLAVPLARIYEDVLSEIKEMYAITDEEVGKRAV